VNASEIMTKSTEHTVAVESVCCLQNAIQISFDATTVSAFRGQSTVTPEWTVLMDRMNVDVVSNYEPISNLQLIIIVLIGIISTFL